MKFGNLMKNNSLICKFNNLVGHFEGCFGSLSYLRNKNEKYKSPVKPRLLVFVELLGLILKFNNSVGHSWDTWSS